MPHESLQGKTALVTGAASGIGRAAALAFARAGARVAVCDIDAGGGEATLALMREAGGEGIALAVDVADEAAVATMVERVVATFGGLDCAFNNAGVLLEDNPRADGRAPGWQEDVFERTWRVNVKGVMSCMKHEIAQMKRQGGGAIVNTASVEGLRGVAGHVSYGASKHAVLGLTRSAALEVGRLGIRINALCPGAIRTPMLDEALRTIGAETLAAYHPLGRIGEPEEVAAAAVWLCSSGASFITGHALPVDGGMLCG